MKTASKKSFFNSLNFKGSHQKQILQAFKYFRDELEVLKVDVIELSKLTGLTQLQVSRRLSEIERAYRIKYVGDRKRFIDNRESTFGMYSLVTKKTYPQAQEDLNLKTLKRGVRMLLRKKHLLSNTLIFELEKLNKIV